MTSTDGVQKLQQSLEDWTEMLRVQELPIFSNTAQSLYQSLDDENKGAMELASIIMQDPNLTAKLLKISNSPYYNPSRQKISTVSRAIIVLGAEVIRELTLACSFFEAILSSSNKERANKEIALAIHAAVQSRDLAITLQDSSPEEIFIAALLNNIGQIAFWCANTKQALQINELIEKHNLLPEAAEKQVLGFTLQDLSKKLSKSWHFGGLIDVSNNQQQSTNSRVQIVQMGCGISKALNSGWESSEMREMLTKLEILSGEKSHKAIDRIKKNTAMAITIAQQFGALDASKFISSEIVPLVVIENESLKADKKQIQFQILQDISAHITGEINLNILIELVLEGIHRGVEMDRTLFMLLNSDKQVLNEKMSLGWIRPLNAAKIQIEGYSLKDQNLFFHAIQQEEGLWVEPCFYDDLYSAQIINFFGKHECFIFPIVVEHKPIGLIYADRGINNIPFSQNDFTASKHFSRQANIGLTLYSMKKH